MNLTLATVQTNCTQDKYWRVSVIASGIWEEPSELMPSINNVYLETGDKVVVMYDDDLYTPLILGKLFTEEQSKIDPVTGAPILFKAQNGEAWLIATLNESKLEITTSEGSKLSLESKAFNAVTEKVQVEADDVQVKAKSATISADSITLQGSIKHAGTAVPNQRGAWCGIPACLFSGAPHTSDLTNE